MSNGVGRNDHLYTVYSKRQDIFDHLCLKMLYSLKRLTLDVLNNQMYKSAGTPLKCVSPANVNPLLEEVHAGSSGEQEGGRKLYQKLLDLGYYWPTMEADAVNYARKCYLCQIYGNAIHAPAVQLHSIITPWPFHTWGFDLIGPINPLFKGYAWILATTECFTKWVEAISLKNAIGPAVANFIKENIICRTSKRGPTKATLFSLVYGTEAILSVDILVPSASLALNAEFDNDTLRILKFEVLEEKRDRAKKNLSVYQRRLSRAYDKLVKKRGFEEGDLVLRAT
ncbi:uncharacterized protein LOC110421578 [Herrania umbratica]|uniref:Uncharacterized protein LOC110421578 n=1 Tax=Herrania umbratica TaxID=108875 RepID=A0A6J1AUL8_9ROSI|nr:uncharacterized protein LOC110421578 [Herrania umbratica]